MTPLRFDRAIPDVDAFYHLFETTDWNDTYHLTRGDLERALAGTWRIVCAYDGEELVGVGRLVSDGAIYATMFDVIVAPEWQRQGVGTRIVELLLADCRAANLRDVLLSAAKGTDGFYRRLGFKPRTPEAPGMMRRLV